MTFGLIKTDEFKMFQNFSVKFLGKHNVNKSLVKVYLSLEG